MEKVIEYIAREEDAGVLVRSLLRQRLHLSTTQIKRAKFRYLGITLNGDHVTVRATVRPGDVLRVCVEGDETASDQLAPRPGTLEIAYEDGELLVVVKPAGLPVHPSPGHYDDTLANILVWHFARQGVGFVVRTLGRLDKDTSGLLLVAKNAPAQTALERQRAAGVFRREYLALVEGCPEPRTGTVDAPIAPIPGSLMKREVRADGVPARTDYRVLAAGRDYSLVALRLHTGRTHQIRVHMAHLGHPLVGDFLYGREGAFGMGRTALHAAQLTFRHPTTGEIMTLEAPLPEDMATLARALDESGESGIILP